MGRADVVRPAAFGFLATRMARNGSAAVVDPSQTSSFSETVSPIVAGRIHVLVGNVVFYSDPTLGIVVRLADRLNLSGCVHAAVHFWRASHGASLEHSVGGRGARCLGRD